MKTTTDTTPSAAQIASAKADRFLAKVAVAEFRAANGRQWKSKLRALWNSGKDTGDLRLARNVLGPSGLDSI
jgi:hypothetical protein